MIIFLFLNLYISCIELVCLGKMKEPKGSAVCLRSLSGPDITGTACLNIGRCLKICFLQDTHFTSLYAGFVVYEVDAGLNTSARHHHRCGAWLQRSASFALSGQSHNLKIIVHK